MSIMAGANLKALPPSSGAAGCFHCGLPLPSDAQWSVEIDGIARAMCCPGCEAVASTIVANGLSDYYRTRSDFSPSADRQKLVPAELALYDAPEVISEFAETAAAEGELCTATFSVEGIRCAACVWLIERRLARVPGLEAADLNVATERLQVRWQQSNCKPSDILKAVREVGYVAYPFNAVRHGEQLRRAGKALFRQTFVAGLSMMQVMMYAVPAYIASDGTMEADMDALMRWASLLLTVPAVFYSALPFFRGAWANLKSRMLGMDVPVALGIAAAFIGSTVATWRGEGEVYFDSVTMFIFLLLCSRHLELMARRKAASALESLQHALPASAQRVPGYPDNRDTEQVPAAQLREGDVILVKPGEAIAADCVILEGHTAIDLSLLSGESLPVRRVAGDTVPGGAVNATQMVLARVLKPARESTLSALLKLIERAGQAKPQLSLWADKVAAWFVAGLLLFAVLVFAWWQMTDPARAWPIAIAVLVVSCPCALSLATPTALAAATDRLLRRGVLVVQPHVLETLHRATHVVFDKTGTLTVGKPGVEHIETFAAGDTKQCLRIAAALELTSAHPLALAILDAAFKAGTPNAPATEVRYHSGQGLEGLVDGVAYRLGNAAFVEQLTHCPSPGTGAPGSSPVYLGSAAGWLARFDLVDALRPDAKDVVDRFREAGKIVVLLSGDQQAVTQRIAAQLGIEAAYGDRLPEQKVEFVQGLQASGAMVAMAGDGINDAAVMRAADVSFAMGSGAALAQAHADTVLLSGRLSSVWETAKTAAMTMSVVRQNLFWAMLYNVTAIPAAALGWINPWLASVGMSLSSAAVVLNALRLRRIQTARKTGAATKVRIAEQTA